MWQIRHAVKEHHLTPDGADAAAACRRTWFLMSFAGYRRRRESSCRTHHDPKSTQRLKIFNTRPRLECVVCHDGFSACSVTTGSVRDRTRSDDDSELEGITRWRIRFASPWNNSRAALTPKRWTGA